MTIKKGADKAQIQKLIDKLSKASNLNGIDAYKYCGIIKLKESPNNIQKRLRNEWD